MNNSVDNYNGSQSNGGGSSSIFKKPWFIALAILAVILIGFGIMFLVLKNKVKEGKTQITQIEYNINNNNNITIPIYLGTKNINIEIVDDSDVNVTNTIIVSRTVLEQISKINNIEVVNNQNNSYTIYGPISIKDITIHQIEASVVENIENVMIIPRIYFVELFGDFDIKDGILILKGMPDDYKRYFLFYFIGICFISYLVCQFGFKESIVVTANSFDKYLLIFTGILVLIWGWNIDTPPNEILTWVKRIAVVCVAVTFGFTVIQNLPNPLYILLGVLAKLFVLIVIILAIMIIIAIFFVVLVFTIVSSRNNDNDNNSETWEFHYDEYLDKIIATRRN